jgi:hypothetical protein
MSSLVIPARSDFIYVASTNRYFVEVLRVGWVEDEVRGDELGGLGVVGAGAVVVRPVSGSSGWSARFPSLPTG